MSAPTREATRAAVQRALAPGRGETVWDDARKFYMPAFPSAARLAAVAGNLNDAIGLPDWDGTEGSRGRLEVGPGLVRVRYKNLARHEHTAERAIATTRRDVHELAAYFARHGEFPPEAEPSRIITHWSRKSRANMWAAFFELDYAPMFRRGDVPAMITLTYPDQWLTVAPAGADVKRHMKAFRKRFQRAWCRELVAIWKMEFQLRGAPHVHMMMTPPHGKARRGRFAGLTFKDWLSQTWADVVDHPDPEERRRHVRAGTGIDYPAGLKATDPRRVGVYFAKHGSFAKKEYQNTVPAAWREPGKGPGRFWGYWGFRRRVHGVELSHRLAAVAARTIRRHARAQGVTQRVEAARYAGGKLTPAGPIVGLAGVQELAATTRRTRGQRRRVKRMRGKYGAGWVGLNDGPSFAEQLGRYLATLTEPYQRARARQPRLSAAAHAP